METKIFILKLKRFGRGGVNGEFSLGILEFLDFLGVRGYFLGNSRILCVIVREQSRGSNLVQNPSKIPSLGSKATEARNSL